jgi:ABC-type uncharacterized transport system ATPase subunit
VSVVDVEGDADLAERYGSRVPVVLAASGSVLAEGRITSMQAWAAVRAARKT